MAMLGVSQSLHIQFLKDSGRIINSTICVMILTFLVSYPIFVFYFLRKNQAKL